MRGGGFDCTTNRAFGWIYPEHRDIAVLAVEGLDPERKAEFDLLWQETRVGDEKRLCTQTADTAQGITPECIDWAALLAIAGDHSCSSEDMLEVVRTSEWIHRYPATPRRRGDARQARERAAPKRSHWSDQHS